MPVTASQWRQMFGTAARAFDAEKERLCELDGEIGDGDHGITMALGWKAVTERLARAPESATCGALSQQAAQAFLNAVGASSGPLYATALMRGAAAVGTAEPLEEDEIVAFFTAAVEGIRQRGKAEPGDKTMLDAWLPAVQAMQARHAEGAPLPALLHAAREGAERGAEATRDMIARRGRAGRLGERSRGHLDPGAVSAALLFRVVETSLVADDS